MARAEIEAWMARHNVTIESVFVPFSKSRNKDKKSRFDKTNSKPAPEYSLNWRVSVLKDGKKILKTDYSMGRGHCYAYKHPRANKYITDAEIEFECEVGAYRVETESGQIDHLRHTPDCVDVLYSLSNEAEVFEYAKFEEWALDFGYDTDSRSAEKIFQACNDTTSKMFGAFGEDAMDALADACQDF